MKGAMKIKMGEVVGYALKLEVGMRVFLQDGRVEIDTDVVEQPLFRVSLGFGGFYRQASTILA